VRAVPRLCELYPGICLTTEEKARKNLSQGMPLRMIILAELAEVRIGCRGDGLHSAASDAKYPTYIRIRRFPPVHYIPRVYMTIKMRLNPTNNFRVDLLFMTTGYFVAHFTADTLIRN
jgi:hypothetical protein